MDNNDDDYRVADEIEEEVTARLVRRWSRTVAVWKQVLLLAVAVITPIASAIALYYSFKGDLKEIRAETGRNRGTIEIIWFDFYHSKLPP